MLRKAQKIDGNLVKCPLLQGSAYPEWRPEISSEPENQPGGCAAHENGAKLLFSEKHVHRRLPTRSTGPSGVLLVVIFVHIQAT